jgi:hypothetical protein
MAVVIAVGAAAPAAAAPPWTAPVAIGASDAPPRVEANELDQSQLVPRISAGKELAGPQLVQWRGGGDGRVLVALNGQQTIRVRTSSFNVASSRYAVSRVLHFDAKVVDRSNLERKQLGYRIGSADLATFGRERRLGNPRSIRYTPKLAVNADGAAIAAWHHIVRGHTDEIEAVWRPAGGSFGKITRIAADDIDDESIVGVGIDSTGRAIVAYNRGDQLAVRAIRTASGWMSKESRVPVTGHPPTEITVGANEPGLVVVAWRGYPVSEGPSGTVDVGAAVLGVGSNRLGSAQQLASGNLVGYPRGPIVATVDAAGRPLVAFTVPSQPNVSVPMVAQADNAGRFGVPQALDTSGSIGALIRKDEGVAVGWLKEAPGPEGHGDPLGVFVARRGPDGAFGAGELVDTQSLGSGADGLQPPALGQTPSGGLVAVYANAATGGEGEARVSTAP